MQRFDIVVIGAGGAGEAAAHLATGGGASVAVIDRELFGGSCPFWACMPSKARCTLHQFIVPVATIRGRRPATSATT